MNIKESQTNRMLTEHPFKHNTKWKAILFFSLCNFDFFSARISVLFVLLCNEFISSWSWLFKSSQLHWWIKVITHKLNSTFKNITKREKPIWYTSPILLKYAFFSSLIFIFPSFLVLYSTLSCLDYTHVILISNKYDRITVRSWFLSVFMIIKSKIYHWISIAITSMWRKKNPKSNVYEQDISISDRKTSEFNE